MIFNKFQYFRFRKNNYVGKTMKKECKWNFNWASLSFIIFLIPQEIDAKNAKERKAWEGNKIWGDDTIATAIRRNCDKWKKRRRTDSDVWREKKKPFSTYRNKQTWLSVLFFFFYKYINIPTLALFIITSIFYFLL